MHSFLFVVSLEKGRAAGIAKRCAETIKLWRPDAMDVQVNEGLAGQGHEGGVELAWCSTRPGDAVRTDLIGHVAHDDACVVVFGSDVCGRDTPLAETIYRAWVTGGGEAVRRVDASFGAVVVDRRRSEVLLVHDAFAHYSLSYLNDSGTLVVSPHDYMLAAAGYCAPEPDLVSIASIPRFGWSIGGRSLIKGVERCGVEEFYTWREGQMLASRDPLIDPEAAVEGGESRYRARQIDRMIEIARARMKNAVAGRDVVKVELSAGIDSRVVFALAIDAIDNEQELEVVCVGNPDSPDVRVAGELCQRYGLDFAPAQVSVPEPDEFLRECDRFALAVNGTGTSIRLMTRPVAGYGHGDVLQLHGNGGEIYRGRFYPGSEGVRERAVDVAKARRILRDTFKERGLDDTNDALTRELWNRFDATLDGLAASCRSGFDLLDLFYAAEKYAVWAQARSRMTWRFLWTPYGSTDLARTAFALPSPIGRGADFHREVVRRLASRGYWLRINDSELLPLRKHGTVYKVLQKVDRRWSKPQQRKNLRRLRDKSREIGSLREDGLRQKKMWETVHDLLSDQDSLSVACFGRDGINRMLERYRSGATKQDILAPLITVERWWTQLKRVRQLEGLSRN